MESSSPPSSTTSMGAARGQEEPAPTPAPSNRDSGGRQGGGGGRGGGGGGGGGKGPTGGGSTKKKKKKDVALPRMGAGGGEQEEEEDQPSIRVHEDIKHFKPPISPEVRVHVPGCRCMETFRHRLAAGKRPGYVVVPAKGHKDTCFFFPSPHHSLDTEKDLSSVLSGRGLSIKLTTCSRMMLGPRVAPTITYLHGAAVILGDGSVLQRLADQYEQHRLKRKEAVAKQEQEGGGQVMAMADDEAAMFVVVPLPRGVQTRSYLQGLEKQLEAHHKIVSSGVSKVVAEHHLRSSLAGLDHQLVRRHLLPLLLDQQGGARLEEPALLAMVQSWPDAHNLDILGGKRDLGETSMQATHREAWEESGGLVDLSDSGAFVRVPGLDQRDQAMAFFAYLYLPPEQRKPPAAGGGHASSTTEGQQQQAGPTFASPSRAHTAPLPSPQEAGVQQQGEAGPTPAPQPQHPPPPPPPSRSQQLQQLRPTARPFTYRPATGPSPAAPPPPPPYHNQRHQQPWEQQPQQHGGWEGGRPWPTESSSSSRPGGLTSGRRRPQHGQGGGGAVKGAGGQDEDGEAVMRAEGPPVRHQQHHGRGRGAGGQPWHWG